MLLYQIPLLLISKDGLMGAVPMAQSSRPSQLMLPPPYLTTYSPKHVKFPTQAVLFPLL